MSFALLSLSENNKCDVYDAGEEPCYAGVPMSTIIERGYGVGDVISLLWFKRSLPRYCTQFIEVIYGLNVDMDNLSSLQKL